MPRFVVAAAALVLCLGVLHTIFGEGRLGGDAKGSGVLDIASVRQGDHGRLFVHRLTTYRPLRPAVLAKGSELSFYFDTDGDLSLERRLDVRYVRGRLAAVMQNRRGTVVGHGVVSRPNRRTVVVTFARSLLRPGILRYRWFAFAGFRCHHRYDVCGDRVPAGGALITHRLLSRTKHATRPARPTHVPVEPAPIAGRGYHLAFHDEFNTFNGGAWGHGRWSYGDDTPRNSVYARNGTLHLVSRRSHGYPDIATSTEGGARPARFKQGYFEARMKWTKGNGAWPAFWLLSYRHVTNSLAPKPACPGPLCLAAELDVFEGQGAEPSVYYGTLHRNSCTCYGSDKQNANNRRNVRVDLTAGWRTYAARWTDTAITWYLDGRPLMSAPVFDSTNQKMVLILQMWIGGWTTGSDSSTADSLDTQVDWVRVWQR